MRTINKLIIHCTATPEGRETTVTDIDRWHKEKGYNSIGYHYVIYLDGSVHKGRNVEVPGAHTLDNNYDSIGIAYVGGGIKTATDTRTSAQKKSMLKLLKGLKHRYPRAKVYSHRDFNSTSCPGFDAKKEYENI